MDEDFYRRFGQRLRRARKAAGLSQADLATAIELTRTSVSNIEKGRQKVLLHTFRQLLDVLDVSAGELLPAGAPAPPPPPGLNNLQPDARAFVERGLRRFTKEDHAPDSLETDSNDRQGSTGEI